MKLGEIISKAKVTKCKDKDLPVLSITLRDGFVLQSSHFKKEIASKDKSKYNVVKKNQLVQSIHLDEGGFSVQYIVDEGIVSPAYRIWDVDISLVNPVYLNTFLRSKPSIAYYKSKLRGTIHRRGKIDDSDILGMEIPVPPLSEQERIVAALNLLQGIIDKQKAQLKELDTLAQSIFYSFFGDILEAKLTKTLKDVAKYNIGLTYKPTDVSDKGIIVLRSSNIQENRLDFKDIVRVNAPIDKKKMVEVGDILMCVRNGSASLVGKVARICNLTEEMSFGAFMTIIRSDFNDFLFHFFLSPYFRRQLSSAKTATINQITTKMLDGIQLNVPSIEKQQVFADKIKAIESQKFLINQSIAETQKLFDYTMDKYFG